MANKSSKKRIADGKNAIARSEKSSDRQKGAKFIKEELDILAEEKSDRD